jgi:4-hydroxybenzoate polyprenyltransferase
MAAGFMYNTICDAPKDPIEKNPINRGDISEKNTFLGMVLLILGSISVFLILYKSYIAFSFFLVYIFLWLAYSGLRIRFKETVLGPLVASIVLFVGAPFIILLEFNYFDLSSVFLLLGLFLIYIAHEIAHTIKDYDVDKSYNCKTFAIILGRKYSAIIEYLTIIMGVAFLLGSSILIQTSIYFNLLLGIMFICSIITMIFYGFKSNFTNRHSFIRLMPYLLTRIFIIGYACLILDLSPLLILFIIWISLTK